jgi:serine/threonine protein kinase
MQGLVKNVKTFQNPPAIDEKSEECMDFLSKCLIVDPEERYSATQLLEHPYIIEISNSYDLKTGGFKDYFDDDDKMSFDDQGKTSYK